MPPVPVDAFESEFRSLPASERTAFVADLWTARGWETTVEDGVLVAEQDDERRRIRVVDPGRFGTPSVSEIDVLVAARDRDAVRVAADDAGVEYIPPTDLRHLLLYGIDREAARDLYEERFSQSLERAPPSEDEEDGAESGEAGGLSAALPSLSNTGPSLSSNRRAVVALVLLALVGVAIAGPSLPGASAPAQSPITVSDVTPGDETAGAVGAASPTPTAGPEMAPGINSSGVVSARALADAHAEGVRNRSRVRSVEMIGSPNASVMGGTVAQNLTTRIVNESHYRHRAESRFADEEEWTGGLGVYAAGDGVYQRLALGNDTRYSRYSVAERPATLYDDLSSYLYRYFLGADGAVVSCAIEYDTDCPTYRIEIDGGAPNTLGDDVDDYQALLIVSDRGVITTIRASYTLPDSDDDGEREPVSFALDYRFETVDPEPPTWLDDARNATANGTATASETPTPTG